MRITYFYLLYFSVWAEGGRGLFSLPMAPEEVTQEEMIDNFPVKYDDIVMRNRCIGVLSLFFLLYV